MKPNFYKGYLFAYLKASVYINKLLLIEVKKNLLKFLGALKNEDKTFWQLTLNLKFGKNLFKLLLQIS